jgi:DNA-binding NarL/FixJ family response regulator
MISQPQSGEIPCRLCEAYESFVAGLLHLERSYVVGDRVYLAARVTPSRAGSARSGLTPRERRVFERVLCGEQQKAVAFAFKVAPSTVSHNFRRALAKLGVSRLPVPLPVVVLAQHAAGVRGWASEAVRCDDAGPGFVVLSVRRPDMSRASPLSAAEHEVAGLFLEGLSRSEIARRRGTSQATTARQLHCVFSALRLFGRYALAEYAARAGCLC